MNRRGFFNSLGKLVGAAAVAPAIFIPKLEPVKWKPPIIFQRPNPAWTDAKDFYGEWQFITYVPGPNGVWIKDNDAVIPVRYDNGMTPKNIRVELRAGQISFHDVQLSEKAS